ncbi:acyl-CoA dehydrogenase, partial [Streptomyces sp. SID10244]|nr:acyl-CoA dehydrogenase [Streptomyces sp. SID10244]
GWKVAMGLLQFERGVSTLGQQVGFDRELRNLMEIAESNGSAQNPEIASRITRAWIGLKVMRAHAQRTLAGDIVSEAGQASVAKLLWANWHRDLGELAMAVVGAPSLIGPTATVEGVVNDITDPDNVELDDWQRLFLF